MTISTIIAAFKGLPLMRWIGLLLMVGLVGLTSCHYTKPQAEAWYSYYHAPQFGWDRVGRVLLLPLTNETAFPHAPEEMRNSLASEMQRLGRFEVVPAPPEVTNYLSCQIRDNGTFNEAAFLQLGRAFRADVIVLGALTQYSPYQLPRVGVALQAVSPLDGTVIGSVDGLWDASDVNVAKRVREAYRTDALPREAPVAAELALDSPRLFQRFVAAEAAHILVAPPGGAGIRLAVPPHPGLGWQAGSGATLPAGAGADPRRDGH